MRILIKLQSINECSYDLKYFHKMQGVLYNLFRKVNYTALHDREGYKFFCFSNIFPIGDFKEGDERYLLVSSPLKGLIVSLKEELEAWDKILNIGEMSFTIKDVKIINPKIRNNTRIITATPIIIRIPNRNYDKYGIESDKDWLYWRPEYSFSAFVKQLEGNLIKKYNEFYKENMEEIPIFGQFKFKKEIVNHVVIDGVERMFVGSIWEFIFSHLSSEQKKILKFGLETGFGERNSLGFGFVNVVR